MNCLDSSFSRIGGISSELEREGDRIECEATRVGGLDGSATRIGGISFSSATRIKQFSVMFGLVCGVDLGDEVLWASDQMVLTIEGNKIFVKRA